MKSLEEVVSGEEALRTEVAALEPGLRKAFYERSEKVFKDPDTYVTLNYLLVSGLHHFYLGKWARGLLDLVLNLLGLALVATGVFLGVKGQATAGLVLGALGAAVWAGVLFVELAYLFKAQAVVRGHNLERQRRILAGLKEPSAQA